MKQVSRASVLSFHSGHVKKHRCMDSMPSSLHLGLSSLEREMSMMMTLVANSEAATALGYRILGERGYCDPRTSAQMRHPRAGQKRLLV